MPWAFSPRAQMAEKRNVQRLPVPAMNEDDDRAFAVYIEQIDRVACAGPIRQRMRRVLRAIGGGICCPAGDQRRIFRNPRPVVVFDLVVDAGHAIQRPSLRGLLRRGLGLGQQPHQFANILRAKIGKHVGDPALMLGRHLAKLGAAGFCQPDHLDAAVGYRRFAGRDGRIRPGARPARSHCRSRPSSASTHPTASCRPGALSSWAIRSKRGSVTSNRSRSRLRTSPSIRVVQVRRRSHNRSSLPWSSGSSTALVSESRIMMQSYLLGTEPAGPIF